jgi:hypothetical protein
VQGLTSITHVPFSGAGRVSRKDQVTRARRYKVEPELRPEQFDEGLRVRPRHCPRCGQLLQQEPSAVYCRWGCTRRFLLVGCAVQDQFEWERSSGLIGGSSPTG